jgi:hypothetical protein
MPVKSPAAPVPLYRLRASRLMMGLSIVYVVLWIGLLIYAALGRGAWGQALLGRTGSPSISVPAVLIASMLLFALPAILLYTGSRAVYAGKPWGRVAGFLVAGLLLLMIFPYGLLLSCVLFWTLIAHWPPPARLELPKRPVVPAVTASPAPTQKSPTPHAWNTDEMRRWAKRPKKRSR